MFLSRPFSILIAAVLVLSAARVPAQQKPPPTEPVRAASALLLYPGGATRVVETFSIIQQANQGIPAAQLELGYRYIVGRGIPADSAKGAEWILKAARNGVALGEYNAGILYTHAIGVPWDPFKAYTWFKQAADKGLPAGQFIFGVLHVDGLVVERDYAKAYDLVRQAYEQGYTEAQEALEEFRRRGFDTLSVRPATVAADDDSTTNLVMLHFENVQDPDVGDTVLIRELERELGHDVFDSTITLRSARSVQGDSIVHRLDAEAERGIPEAHMVLGRMLEKGIGVRPDLIRAAVHYLRANRLDSPRAPSTLVNLIERDAFRTELLKRAQNGDRDARFVWAGLSAIGLDNVIGWEQALRFLEEQSRGPEPHVHSCLELGFWYASGRNVDQDPRMAIGLWERADSLGTREGRTRVALTRLVLRESGERERTQLLHQEAEEGSVLAQTGYAYCLRFGIGTKVNKPEASSWYRKAAQRGSLSAYDGLRGMYDELRPPGKEFRIE